MTSAVMWTCEPRGFQTDRPVGWLRFDATYWQDGASPRFFFSRIARFETITFAAIDESGAMRTASFAEDEAETFPGGPVFRLPLPELRPETQVLLVRIDRPHSAPLLAEARLAADPDSLHWSMTQMMVLAMVIGMLLLPLLFDLGFFAVLRERFVALHAVMVIAMMVYVLFAGGLISLVVSLPVAVVAIAGPLAWAIGCGVSALFLAKFLEEDAQSKQMRILTQATGIWTIIVPGFFALQLHATQAYDDRLYFYTFLPTIAVISAALVEAVLRGSRSARFVTVAWIPLILASIERLWRGLGIYVGPPELDLLLFVATGFEVTIISLAIADRFFAIRRERDEAVESAMELSRLSERDPLTGLMNRRAITARFPDLIAKGFDTFALVDLDRFKQVNDKHGHQAGDAALVAAAEALRVRGSRDSVPVRLGGEEFVVLLRGPDAINRVEALRQAIPLHVARKIPGLEAPLTASMGVVEMPRSATADMTFGEFYARADKLLYDAKKAGRNRMNFERLKVFSEAPPSRRPKRKRAA
ncbi:GGDEF domain-containing protein [Erythrobacter rubeus]|nr:diguanylate cyclase [Erythrobacter rubeus]